MPNGVGCRVCGREAPLTSAALRVCPACARLGTVEAREAAEAAHRDARALFGLPLSAPESVGGVRCPLCARQCRIARGERGFCGLRTVRNGRLVHLAGTPARALLQWYRDPLPTNCVADWVCTGTRQRGRHNLAVFCESCTLDCLFCQNWHYRRTSPMDARGTSAAALAAAANPATYCVCFFGGDPASQMPHALAAAGRLAAKGVVVCWETAGLSHPRLLDRVVDLSLRTGGCIKFDVKAFGEALHQALTGASNARTLDNLVRAARRARERPSPPLVVASTLLVPGYVDAGEVGRIARFLASVDREIPYALLGFAPHFLMTDLPPTSTEDARLAAAAAREAGLTNVRVGNMHLLSGST